MKKMLFLLAALVAFALPSAASAINVEGFYAGGLGAANFLETNKRHHQRQKFNVGYAAGGLVGYRWCQGWRLEGEATYRNNQRRTRSSRSSNRGHYHSWSFMANGYYEFADYSCFLWDITPYVDAGIGYTTQRTHRRRNDTSSSSRHKKHGFAWQVGAGLSYPIWECAEISLDYRFHKGRERKFYNHTLGAIVKYYF